jgi:hypothetical protein
VTRSSCTAPEHVVNVGLWCQIKVRLRAGVERWNAYTSGRLVQEYKRAGGKFRGPKREKREKPLAKWYREDWVDLSRPLPGGGYAPCGRTQAERRAYPLCRPAKVAAKISPTKARAWVKAKRRAGGADATVRFPARFRVTK